jgi:hypothetical protein
MIIGIHSLSLGQSGAPPLLPFQGRLVDSTGEPIRIPTHIRIQIIQGGTANGNPTRGRVVFAEYAEVAPDENGYFDYLIGSNADGRSEKRALNAKDLNTTEPVFIEVALTGEDSVGKATFTLLLPRQQMASVGYALQAEMAKDAAVDDRFVNVAGDKMTGPLTVGGPIESTSGGMKFPDGTLQTTAGLATVAHDATLTGAGTSGTPLKIADGGVGTNQLAPGAVTGSKIALGQVVKSLNGLFDNMTLAAGANVTITPSGNTLTVSAPNALASVSRDSTLTGSGVSGSPLGIADNGVTSAKIAAAQVVKSLNSLKDDVTLAAGANITMTSSGSTLTVAAPNALTSVSRDSTLTGSGVSGSPLGIADNGVTSAKIAAAQVVKSLNSLKDNVTLAAGTNITITSSGSTLTVAAPNALGSVSHNTTLTGDGTSGSPLSVAVPLSLSGTSAVEAGIIEATNSTIRGSGVRGVSPRGVGVYGRTGNTDLSISPAAGVVGVTDTNGFPGVYAESRSSSQSALSAANTQSGGTAATFLGGVQITGNLSVGGTLSKSGGSFKIDHPLDPANKYLSHSFVESPDMMNIYNGNVILGPNGEAVIELPAWFEALNKEFRYQLTPIGGPGSGLYIAEEVADNRFKIAGGRAGLKVSWQVTGIRHDPWAEAHRIPVEEEKPEKERGYYLHPVEWGQSDEKNVEWARQPEMMKQLRAAKQPSAQSKPGTEQREPKP